MPDPAPGRCCAPLTALVLVLCLLPGTAPRPASAQPSSLRGFITDHADGEAMEGVNVALQSEDGVQIGTSTSADGYFILHPVPPGRYAFLASYVGYTPHRDTLDVLAGEQRIYSLSLAPGETLLGEVLVEAEGRDQAIATAGLQTIRPRQMRRVPMPDVSGDLMGYLQTLPSVVSPGDRGGQLFIRGGTPAQNLTLLDGIPVYQPFHLIGFYSAFPADVIRQADLHAGGFDARYGGRLSSVIDVSTRNGDKSRFRGAASMAPFLSLIQVEGPLAEGRTSFIASVRESVVERLLPDLWSGTEPFRFGDVFVKLHARPNDGSQLAIIALRTHDEGRVDETEAVRSDDFGTGSGTPPPDRPAEQINWRNGAYGFRYLVFPEQLPVLGELTVSYSHFSNEVGPPGAADRRSSIRTFRAATTLTHPLRAVELRWGAVFENINLRYDLDGVFQDLDTRRASLVEAGVFFDADVPLGPTLTLHPGLHVHTFAGGDLASRLEPRLRAVWYLTSRTQLSAAAGLYHQNLTGLRDERDAGDVFTAWTPSPVGDTVPRSAHLIAGWQVRPADGLEIGLEGYLKTLSGLAVPAWSPFPRFTTTLQAADGYARGLDARLVFDRSPLYVYLGYGLSEVNYTVYQESFRIWYDDPEQTYPPPHDRRHSLNALGTLELGEFELSLRWEFGSGLPFTRPIGFDDWILFETLVDVRKEPGRYRVIFERPYQGRLPAYHRLDLSIKRTFDLPGGLLTLQAGLINAYDRDNLFYFDVWTLRRVNQMRRTPSLGLRYETR